MLCDKCGNDHPGHDCSKYVDYLKLDNAGMAYDVGVPHGSTICEAVWYPCDKTCMLPAACKGHIECQCRDYYGNEFYRLLTMSNASALLWKTKMRIYQIGDDDITKVNRVESRKPSINACPECGADIAHEGGCMSCYSCGWSACG
jgi:hypothetical protein